MGCVTRIRDSARMLSSRHSTTLADQLRQRGVRATVYIV